MGVPDANSPLSRSEAELLDSSLLPYQERHHLRLLAHGLRSFQAMAGRREGSLPNPEELDRWLLLQPGLVDDPCFHDALRQQLVGLGHQLEQIAAEAGSTPLALSLDQLIHWARGQADSRLQQQQTNPGQHQ